MARIHGLVLLAVALGALVLTAPTAADEGLIVRRAVVWQAEVMTVWGGCNRPIYLVPDSFAKNPLLLLRASRRGRPPTGPSYHFLGRTKCTGRLHYIGDYPDGDWSSWSGYLRFRLPQVRPGRYRLIFYFCLPWRCPNGRFLVGSSHWRGSKRVSDDSALTIRRIR
jgi:hypothetical protein